MPKNNVVYVKIKKAPVFDFDDNMKKEEVEDQETLLNHVGILIYRDEDRSLIRFTTDIDSTFSRWISNENLEEIATTQPFSKYYDAFSGV